ncbi:MAG: gamma-glutamyl-gamma-aminobutyrate hydrolase family protein [Nitrospirae bacterium]|nr:gamma-glutamyl-gamma-aminobutyrate hydrolase family protein [Nitrospirota bacterium]
MTPIIAVTAKTEELRNRPQTTIPDTYAKVIEEAGGIPLIIPVTDKKENIIQIARFADGFLFSGGDDIDPRYYGEEPLADMVISPDERTEFEMALLKEIIRLRKPVLGICLGAQLINITLGGNLYQDIPAQIADPLNHRNQHNITLVEGTILCKVFSNKSLKNRALTTDDRKIPLDPTLEGGGMGGFEHEFSSDISIFSTHHQSVKSPGKGLTVSALSSDGVIEAIELPDYPFLIGVQWHPEREPESVCTRLLFHAFIKAAKSTAKPDTSKLA